jgi:hypothetical protein
MELPITTVVDQDGAPFASGAASLLAAGFRDGAASEKTTTSAKKKEIERLRSKNAEYERNEKHWRFLLMSYEGGPEYPSSETLFRFTREHADDFSDRLKRAVYQNYCQPLVDFVPDFIFNHEIDRDAKSLSREFDDFKHNVDRAGTSLNNFMKQVSQIARIFGMCYIQVDKPALPESTNPEEVSLLQAQELGLGVPYLICINPLEVLDWSFDSFGNLLYLKRVQLVQEPQGDGFVFSDIERYHEWTPKKYKITDIDVTDPKKPRLIPPKSGDNTLGTVPFIQHFHRRSKINKDIGQAFINDIAYQNRSVFNYSSLIDEFLHKQCFNILAMERDTTLPTANAVDGEVGQSNVLEIPREAKHRPEYISPPADPAEFIQSERENCIKEMYRQAAQDVMHELFARSGDAIQKGFSRTIPVIADQADQLQSTETHVMKMWAKAQKKKWDGKIAYKDDYSITNLLDLVVQLTSIFRDIKVLSPTFVKEEWKRIVREFDGKIDPEQMAKIISEINSTSDKEILDMLNPPEPVNAKTAPGVATASQLMQGKEQKQLGTDKRRALAKGDRSATKETVADGNKRTQQPSSK